MYVYLYVCIRAARTAHELEWLEHLSQTSRTRAGVVNSSMYGI